MQQRDAPGAEVALYPSGDVVQGQVTLDLCGARFASESLRVARRQVAVIEGQQPVFSTEAVLYRNAAAVGQALDEIHSAVASCPAGFVAGDVAGEPPVKTSFGAAPDTTWPAVAGVGRLALDMTMSDQAGMSEHTIEVFLSRGALLEGLYFRTGVAGIPIAGQSTPAGITSVFAHRLAALPASAVA